jgi:hypothetical protein
MTTTPRAAGLTDRGRAGLALYVILLVGSVGAWMGWSTAEFFTADCRAGALACTAPGQVLMTLGGPVAVAVAATLAVIGMHQADRRWARAAWATWGTYCAVWWVLLLTS